MTTANSEPFIATVCWFGMPTLDDRLVLPGAIWVGGYPLPIIRPGRNFDPSVVVGYIEMSNSTPEEFVVFGTVERHLLPADDDGDPITTVGMDLGRVEVRQEGRLAVFTSAELRAITVTPTPAYPAAQMRFEEP